MRPTIYKHFSLALIILGLSFYACQQDEMQTANADEKNLTRAPGDVVCNVTTKQAGKLDSLITVDAKKNKYTKEIISHLYIAGPINQSDVNVIKKFQYLDSVSLEKVVMITEKGDTTQTIGGFDSFMSPATILLPKSITKIGHQAFYSAKCTSIHIPDNVTEIESWAFRYSSIESIQISNSVSIIGDEAFYDCNNLKAIKLPSTLRAISNRMLFSCDNLVSIEIPQSVYSIGSEAFAGCAMTTVKLPESIREIGEGTFSRCPNLESVVWPQKLTTIPKSTFEDSPKFKTVIPEWIESIGNDAYNGCQGSTTITIPNSVTSIGSGAFADQAITSIKIPKGKPLAEWMFKGCTELQTVELPENATSIPNYMFQYCSKLKDIKLLTGITSIGYVAFEGCTSLSKLDFPNTLTAIESNAFINCTALKEINLPKGLKSIGSYAFQNTPIETLTVPSTVESCGNGIVNYCSNITAVFWNSSAEAPDLRTDGPTDRNLLVYLPPEGKSSSGNSNQIIVNKTTNLYLASSGVFKCPRAFTAEKVYCTVNYSWDWDYWNNPQTAPGKSAGWQTIALPYAPTSIYTEEDNPRTLAPFNAGVENAKPFWLRELTSEGFKNVTKIEANKPYIIAMPYNDNYLPEYNIRCRVTFFGKNVEIPVTPKLVPSVGPSFSLFPAFAEIPGRADILNANSRRFTHTTTGKAYEAGSVFVSATLVPNQFGVETFQAYIPITSGTRSIIEIGNNSSTRSAKKVGKVPSIDDM